MSCPHGQWHQCEICDEIDRAYTSQSETIEQLKAKVAELEAENARLKAESRDASLGLNDYYGRKLAAEQLNSKRLRKALEAVIKVHGYESGIPVEALSTPASTEALDKYVAEKVKDVQLQYIEHKQHASELTMAEAMRNAICDAPAHSSKCAN